MGTVLSGTAGLPFSQDTKNDSVIRNSDHHTNEKNSNLRMRPCKMYWKTIHMLIKKNERSANIMPPLRDRDDNFNLSYDYFEKANILNRHFCSVSDLNDKNKDLPPFEVRCFEI
jgi:hypothetical protein